MRLACAGMVIGMMLVGTGCRPTAPQATTPPEQQQYERGVALAQKGDTEGALTAFASSSRINPAFAPAALALAEQERRTGAFEQASQRLEQLLKANPQTPDIRCRLAEIALQSGHFVQGVTWAKAELTANPKCPLALAQQGIVRQMAGDEASAAESFAQAHEEAPQAELFTLTLAQLRARAGKADEAWKLLESLPASPRYPAKTAYLRGWLTSQFGKKDAKDDAAALTELENALRAEPEYAPALLEKARIWLRQGKPQDALRVLKQVQQQGATDADALALYAEAAAKAKQADAVSLRAQAQTAQRMETELHAARRAYLQTPDDVAVKLKLAKAEAQNGNRHDARELVLETLKKDPNNPQALALLEQSLGARPDETSPKNP